MKKRFAPRRRLRIVGLMRALLAFDKFKDALTAPQACDIAAAALRDRHPGWTLDLCPLSDGGEGFCEILTRAAGGTLETFTVSGPCGTPLTVQIGFVPLAQIPSAARALLGLPNLQRSTLNAQLPIVAVIEMAAASGLALLPLDQRDPWQTTSRGTGEMIRHAASYGASAILLGVGGSATHDLGLGTLTALGLNFLTADGTALTPPTPSLWHRIEQINGNAPPSLPPLYIACDVANPLLGHNGAAAVYGPQKGLLPADLARLENESARLALMLCSHCQQPDALMAMPGAGAAGGIAFGLMTGARARLVPGFDLVSAWLDLDARLAAADLVLTGEGRFDASSLSGKGPGALAARALALGKPTHVFAGAITAAPVPGLALHAVTPPGVPLPTALREAPANLAAAVHAAFSNP